MSTSNTDTPKQRLLTLISIYGGNQSAFARLVGTTQSTVTSWLRRDRLTNHAVDIITAALPDVNRAWLMWGEGSEVPAEQPLPDGMRFVPYYEDVPAVCGTSEMYDTREVASSVLVPDTLSGDIMLTAQGDSMSPTIEEGDRILLRPLASPDEITTGDIYLVITSTGIKAVKRIVEADRSDPAIIIDTDNPHYVWRSSRRILKSDILRLYRVTALMRNL